MWKNLNKATTTTIIALLIVLLGFGLLFAIGMGGLHVTDPGERAQLITGTFSVIGLVAAAYFQGPRKSDKEKE